MSCLDYALLLTLQVSYNPLRQLRSRALYTRYNGYTRSHYYRLGRTSRIQWLQEGSNKDMVRGRGKHVKKTTKNQDATLKRYILYKESTLLG